MFFNEQKNSDLFRERMFFCLRKLFKIFVFRFNINFSFGVSFQKLFFEVKKINLSYIIEILLYKKLCDECF